MTNKIYTEDFKSLLRAFALGLMDRSNSYPYENPHTYGSALHIMYMRGHACLFKNTEEILCCFTCDGLDPSQHLTQQLSPSKTLSSCAEEKTPTGWERWITQCTSRHPPRPSHN
jgi:hypothetical protein